MVRSMTGFGRAITDDDASRSFTIEIKSVNHRYFDLNVKMPRNLASLENKIRDTIKEKICRGKIDVYISQSIFEDDDIEVSFNEKLGDNYFKCLNEIKGKYHVIDDISVSLIARFPEVININKKEENLDEIWKNLKQTLNEAIEALINMRENEGEKLKEDILNKSNTIEMFLMDIEKRSSLVVEDYRNRLNSRIKELLNTSDVDESRIAMEVALFADRAAIDEEIVRLKSHISQLRQTLNKDEPIGRKLDFIVQEMNRETNTISSKANDLEIINTTINIKNYIEKIREQIQNIE